MLYNIIFILRHPQQYSISEQSNSSDEIASSNSGSHRQGMSGVSPTELDSLAVTPIKTNTTSFANGDHRPRGASNSTTGTGKRISLEASAVLDTKMKTRNSIFVTSGTNILEGRR